MTMKTADAVPPAATSYANRRAYERMSARFDVRFKEARDAARALHAYSLNLSAGGLCLRTSRAYDVGARVQLQMRVEGEDFELEGVVSWVRDDAEAIGVRFVDVSSGDQERLQRVVSSFKR
ncbi:TIGR02266 family protein [Archangium primigenium]|jgi:uncharacterized protein (TIGR02266 family)|nr:TIGR02266 family protein [Archangium primigenium]